MQKKAKYLTAIIAVLAIALAFLAFQPKNSVQIKGVIEADLSSWGPRLNKNCLLGATSQDFIVMHEGEKYYLDGICPETGNFKELVGKEVIITGMLEEREFDVPIKKTSRETHKGIFPVISVQSIRLA